MRASIVLLSMLGPLPPSLITIHAVAMLVRLIESSIIVASKYISIASYYLVEFILIISLVVPYSTIPFTISI